MMYEVFSSQLDPIISTACVVQQEHWYVLYVRIYVRVCVCVYGYIGMFINPA